MPRLRIAIVGLTIAAAVAACGSSNSAATSAPSAAAPSTGAPSASTDAVVPSPLGGQTITLSEWKVAAVNTVKAGTTDFTIVNSGTAPHEFLIFKSDLDAAAYPTDAAGDIQEEGAGVTLTSDGENIEPGGSQTRSVDLAPGKYLFVCNIPGHFKQGMFTVVTVTP